MNAIFPLLFVISGLFLLLKGSAWLVDGAVKLAYHYRVSSFVIGLSVVSMGTSLPELAASLVSALHERGDIAFGNVVGSNIANIGLILGISSMIRFIPVKDSTVRREIPFLIAASILVYLLAIFGKIERWMGILLLACIICFLWFCVFSFPAESKAPLYRRDASLFSLTLLIFAGLFSVAVGAELFIRGATGIARLLGIRDAVIGMTMVAIGTSLPELFTSGVAAYKGEPDIVIGNVVGSNIFNLLFIIGITGAVYPFSISSEFLFSGLPVMMLFTAVLIPLSRSQNKIDWKEGIVLFCGYCVYMCVLFYDTLSHP